MDFNPKRIGMIAPEAVALRIINPMRASAIFVFRPLVWLFNGMANSIFRLFKIPMVRKTTLLLMIFTQWWKPALGVLRNEAQASENVFEL